MGRLAGRPTADRLGQTAVRPPSTARIAPLTNVASSDARNTMVLAISAGWAGRPRGRVLAVLTQLRRDPGQLRIAAEGALALIRATADVS
jgi:hypothetical protein